MEIFSNEKLLYRQRPFLEKVFRTNEAILCTSGDFSKSSFLVGEKERSAKNFMSLKDFFKRVFFSSQDLYKEPS